MKRDFFRQAVVAIVVGAMLMATIAFAQEGESKPPHLRTAQGPGSNKSARGSAAADKLSMPLKVLYRQFSDTRGGRSDGAEFSGQELSNLWDVATGKQIRSFEGHTSSVQSVAFSRDGKTILSGSFDGTMKLWRPESDEALATLIALDKTDWVIVTPDGHFDSSPGAEKLLRFVANNPDGQYKIIPFAELKARHYEAGLLQKLLKRGV